MRIVLYNMYVLYYNRPRVRVDGSAAEVRIIAIARLKRKTDMVLVL